MEQVNRMIQEALSAQQNGKGNDSGKANSGFGGNKIVLEEKYFRRMDKFDGDATKFRAWIFDLQVV